MVQIGLEKIFIDKFSFKILKGPQMVLFIGDVGPEGTLDTTNLVPVIRPSEAWPAMTFNITEFSIILNKKEVVTLKSAQLSQAVIRKIKKLPSGSEIRINVSFKDMLLRRRRISGVYYL